MPSPRRLHFLPPNPYKQFPKLPTHHTSVDVQFLPFVAILLSSNFAIHHTYAKITVKMSPSFITIDNTPDFDFGNGNPAPTSAAGRTLILAPPSVATEANLNAVLPSFDRATTDLHMLDRLSAGLVVLPTATYDVVLLLTNADGARHAEAATLLSREVFAALVPSMRAGGVLRAQDGKFGDKEVREAVLAGLVQSHAGEFEKKVEEEVVVPLRFGKKKNGNTNAQAVNVATAPAVEPVAAPVAPTLPAGVGFDFGDDLDDDDELIDEDELMTEEDLNRPIQIRTSTTHLKPV